MPEVITAMSIPSSHLTWPLKNAPQDPAVDQRFDGQSPLRFFSVKLMVVCSYGSTIIMCFQHFSTHFSCCFLLVLDPYKSITRPSRRMAKVFFCKIADDKPLDNTASYYTSIGWSINMPKTCTDIPSSADTGQDHGRMMIGIDQPSVWAGLANANAKR